MRTPSSPITSPSTRSTRPSIPTSTGSAMRSRWSCACNMRGRQVAVILAVLVAGGSAAAQESPRRGGELIFVVPAEPPSYDAHREETFAVVHPAAPHYNTLLRVDPTDRTGTRIVGDLAESWTVAADGRAYAVRIRRGVHFHDGSELTARDVTASYEKIVMGTGPFLFVEYVKGSHWIGRRNPDYWDKGRPYLDGYRALFMRDSAAQVAAIRGQRAMIQFRGFSPPERDTLVQALGNGVT